MIEMRWRPWVGCVLLALSVPAAWADGYRNPPSTAAALGMGGNDRVWVDDASAILVNPANLVDVSNRQVQVSGMVGYSQASLNSQYGTFETRDPWSFLPELALAWPLPQEGITAGLGVSVPYGRQTVWNRNDVLFANGAAPYYSTMAVLDVSPVMAWRLCDQVSVGLGLDFYYGRMEFREVFPGAGAIDARGSGYAIGANAGVTWQVTDRQRLALTFRSPFDLKFQGDTTTENIPGALSESDFSSTFFFPTIIGLGYGVQVTDSLRLEADVEWLQYSRNRRLAIDAGGNNPLLAAANESSMPQNWDDTWTFGLGASWHCAERWTLRAGYLYLQSPIPDSTFMPSMLDSDQSVLASGIGYQLGRGQRLDLAYAVGIMNSRQVHDNQNPAYDGTYDFAAQLVALTYTMDF